jgi:hypothetical protein
MSRISPTVAALPNQVASVCVRFLMMEKWPEPLTASVAVRRPRASVNSDCNACNARLPVRIEGGGKRLHQQHGALTLAENQTPPMRCGSTRGCHRLAGQHFKRGIPRQPLFEKARGRRAMSAARSASSAARRASFKGRPSNESVTR